MVQIQATPAFNVGRAQHQCQRGPTEATPSKLSQPTSQPPDRPNPRAPVSYGSPSMRGGRGGPGTPRANDPRPPRLPGSGRSRPAPPSPVTAPARYPGRGARGGEELTAASVAVAIAVAARAPGVLYDHALATQLLAV